MKLKEFSDLEQAAEQSGLNRSERGRLAVMSAGIETMREMFADLNIGSLRFPDACHKMLDMLGRSIDAPDDFKIVERADGTKQSIRQHTQLDESEVVRM